MIKKIRNHLVAFFNSHTDKIISASFFDRRKLQMQNFALHSNERGISDETYFENSQVIVSLTTYGKRLYDVYLTIESIMQQTTKANRIILWLEDSLKNELVPKMLGHQQSRGLEIRYCKDIKSYKKLIPTLKLFPNNFIITVDDDVIYECDMIENLIRSYKKAPGYVYANRIRRMEINNEGELEEYNTWKVIKEPMTDSALNIPTGVGGVLYPPNCFTEEVFNEVVFMDICGRADDIWFKTMCLINGTQSRLAFVHEPVYYENENVQDIALFNSNVSLNENDKQVAAVFEKYNIYSLLR